MIDVLHIGIGIYTIPSALHQMPISPKKISGTEHIHGGLRFYIAPVVVVSPDFDTSGPSTFIPLSRIKSRCAVADKMYN